MDAQLKRGVLDVCVLAAIRNEDSYGYKIIKDVKPVLDLSESTLSCLFKNRIRGHMETSGLAMHEEEWQQLWRWQE